MRNMHTCVAIGLALMAIASCSAPAQPAGAADSVPAPATATRAAAETTSSAPTPTRPAEPKAKKYQGTGDKVIRIKPTDDIMLVQSIANGTSNFTVYGVGADGEDRELLANGIGKHRGTRIMNLDSGETVALKVGADGPWKIAVKPVTSARHWSKESVSGIGDDVVYILPESAGFQTIVSRCACDGNFVVYGYNEATGESLLANEIGTAKAEDTLPDGTFLVRVEGDGAWILSRTGV